jgi:glutamate-1-semialdehyde 2,1-aminomutase
MNSTLMAHGMPIRFAGMQTIWTLLYELPSRYNWMFQYHLRQRGIALSWVGTGRFIFNFAYTESEFEQFMSCVLLAAQDMKEGGWWTLPEGATTAKVQKQLVKELLGSVLQRA